MPRMWWPPEPGYGRRRRIWWGIPRHVVVKVAMKRNSDKTSMVNN